MATWRFVHAADLHLDSPFVGLRNYQEKLAQGLLAATLLGPQCLPARPTLLWRTRIRNHSCAYPLPHNEALIIRGDI